MISIGFYWIAEEKRKKQDRQFIIEKKGTSKNNTNELQIISNNLRKIMLEKSINSVELSNQIKIPINIPISTINKMLNGKYNPNILELSIIANYFKVQVDDLLDH